jgi:hypothetical protein
LACFLKKVNPNNFSKKTSNYIFKESSKHFFITPNLGCLNMYLGIIVFFDQIQKGKLQPTFFLKKSVLFNSLPWESNLILLDATHML